MTPAPESAPMSRSSPPRGGPVVVVGSLNMDLVLQVPRMPGPGETLTGDGLSTVPGGKGANQAVAAARMGAPVAMVGCVGADGYGAALRAGLAADAIDDEFVAALPGVATGVAVIVVEDDGQNRIVLAPGANARLDTAAIARAQALITGAALLVMQLEVPLESVELAARAARAAGVRVLLNAAPARPLPDTLWAAIDILVVNEGEAQMLCGVPVGDVDGALQAARALHARGPATVVITLGALGVAWLDAQGGRSAPAHPVVAVDTTAAGDTFIGALAAALCEGRDLDEAVALGQAASALCVTRRGAQPSIPYRRELPPIAPAGGLQTKAAP